MTAPQDFETAPVGTTAAVLELAAAWAAFDRFSADSTWPLNIDQAAARIDAAEAQLVLIAAQIAARQPPPPA